MPFQNTTISEPTVSYDNIIQITRQHCVDFQSSRFPCTTKSKAVRYPSEQTARARAVRLGAGRILFDPSGRGAICTVRASRRRRRRASCAHTRVLIKHARARFGRFS